MKRALITAIATAALCSISTHGGPAFAENAALPRNDKIIIDYHEPLDPRLILNVEPNDPNKDVQKVFANYHRLMGIYERLKEHQVLERYAQFLVPLRLPATLRLNGRQCNKVNAYFSPSDGSINLCYELIANIEDGAPKGVTADGVTPDDAIIGGLVSVMLHETGHSVFYMYHIPVLGREEDAADQIAAFIMLQFGDQVALTTVKGALWLWNNWGRGAANYSDEHSTALQRFNTFLCVAYGGKPELFQRFIDKKYLLLYRPDSCRQLYEQLLHAFATTVLPHVDQVLMKKVQSATWFLPEDKGAIPVRTR
jgi:Putative metallopeptidase